MPEYLSIKERVERQVARQVETIADVAVVERWEAAGNSGQHNAVIVVAGDERVVSGTTPAHDVQLCETPIQLHWIVAEARGGENGSFTHNRRAAQLEAALFANEYLAEAVTGERLAMDMTKAGVFAPPVEPEQPAAVTILEVTVQYQHIRGDPTVGPGITRLEV